MGIKPRIPCLPLNGSNTLKNNRFRVSDPVRLLSCENAARHSSPEGELVDR